ncbi:hypothetical protein [Herbaspirillum aquaticum]|nr:hypothetical protein [Herbaspirillum aquaticum]
MKKSFHLLALTSMLLASSASFADDAPFDVNMHIEQGKVDPSVKTAFARI